MGYKILVVDDELLNQKVVSRVLQREGYDVVIASNGQEALDLAVVELPQLVILDVSMPNMDGYEVCRRLRKQEQFAEIPIMMLTAHDTVERKIEGFEAGADDYMVKPFHPAELTLRVQSLMRRYMDIAQIPIDSSTSQARIISVYSLRGGAGVSTLAINLAIALHTLWDAPTALVDLALTCGLSALMLNHPLRHTWSDLANIPVEEYDQQLIDQVMMTHDSGIRFLASPETSEMSDRINGTIVREACEFIKAKNDYIIYDLPHDFRETTLVALDQSDLILLVTPPDIASIYTAKRALATFEKLGYLQDQISLVINWTFPKQGITTAKIESALHRKVDFVVPYADALLIDATNRGVPAVLLHQDTPLASLFEDIAFFISKPEHNETEPQTPTKTWKRRNLRLSKRK